MTARHRSTKPCVLLACAIVAALAAPAGPAHAGEETRIAIESHVGARTAEVARVLAYLTGALERHRYMARPEALKRRLGDHVVYPGLADSKFTAQTFSQQVEAGLNAVVNEQYKAAVQILTSALAGARRNSLVLARDPKSREARLEALIYLARAHKHLGDAAARDETMIEVMRSYPDKVITAKKYGPDAEEIYEAVKRNVDRGGRGRLSVEVTDPDAVIYVDETVRGRGKTLIGDMLPGPHRVLVDGPNGASRQYRVAVLANQETRLEIDWELDSVLVTDDWVGLLLAAEQDREREGPLARRLASAHTSAVMVAVLSAARVNRRVVVTGAVHAVGSGTLARSGRVELTGRRDHDKLDQLAAYLGFQDGPLPDVIVIDPAPVNAAPRPAPAPPPPPSSSPEPAVLAPLASGAPGEPRRSEERLPPASPPRPSHALELTLGGVGTTALVGGAVLISLGDTEGWNARRGGVTALISGAVLTTAAVVLHLRHPKRPGPVITAAPVAGGALGLVGWSFR